MKTKILYVLLVALVACGLTMAFIHNSRIRADAEMQQREKESEKIQAQCIVAKASKSAKEVIAAAFWGVRELNEYGAMKNGSEPKVEALALEAINVLGSLCLQEGNHIKVTTTRTFHSAWRLAELMTTDTEFAEAVDRAKKARSKQHEAEVAKKLKIEEAEKEKASWAVK